MKIMYADCASKKVLDILNNENMVHSVFNNGFNLSTGKDLIFLGNNKDIKLPMGIHMDGKLYPKAWGIKSGEIFRYSSKTKRLYSSSLIIDLNKAHYYNSGLNKSAVDIDKEILKFLLKLIIEMNLDTGLDRSIGDLLVGDEEIINNIKLSTTSKDKVFINSSLRGLMGRGRGLTPAGDDILIGILWLENLYKYLSEEFLDILKELIHEDNLTTDISIGYYKSAIQGEFSNLLIELYTKLINKNKLGIKRNILQIIDYGHTSGRDILAGIAIGIDIIIHLGGRNFENSNSVGRKCFRE